MEGEVFKWGGLKLLVWDGESGIWWDGLALHGTACVV
jgi:hypothetical protein